MTRWLLSSTLSLLVLALVPGVGVADATHYTVQDHVRLGSRMERTLERIARAFHARTGRGIVVTSGSRSASEQAEAMYHKLQLGQRLTSLYLDYDAASEIENAYQQNRRRGRAKSVRAMAQVIERQIARGCYISRHLRASAADVRSRDMTRRERRIFEQVVARFPEVTLLAEGRPPHFHLQLDDR